MSTKQAKHQVITMRVGSVTKQVIKSFAAAEGRTVSGYIEQCVLAQIPVTTRAAYAQAMGIGGPAPDLGGLTGAVQ